MVMAETVNHCLKECLNARINNPTAQGRTTRTQFDWGYFEMLAELGIIGTLIFLVFFFTVLYYLARLAYSSTHENSALSRGLLAGGISLLIINITTPGLFHGFGILYSVLAIVIIKLTSYDVSQ